MTTFSYRALLSGLAVGPAILYAVLPDPVQSGLLARMGPAGVLGALALFGLTLGTQITSRNGGPGGVARPRLLRSLHPRDLPRDLPDPLTMRRGLNAALSRGAGPRTGPETRDAAIARVLQHLIYRSGGTCPADLDDATVTGLTIARRLLVAPAPEAGALAAHFRNPAQMLAIRDDVAARTARRARYDRAQAALAASQAAWMAQTLSPPASLVTALAGLAAPDPDLWHRIVAEHDPRDPAQRDAALWCAGRPDCAPATVALYCARLAEDRQLDAAAARGDADWLDRVRRVIDGWNAGKYAPSDLGLDPPDRVAGDGAAFADALDRLAARTGAARWPAPQGLFAAYPGRAARPRPAWDLRAGRMTRPPRPADYSAD